MRRMSFLDNVLQMLARIGLGTMCTRHYTTYPDLVRQFFSTVSVYYTTPAKRASEGTLTFMLQGQRYRLSLPDLCNIYGFENMWYSASWPSEFTDQQRVWSSFGIERYDSKHVTQTDVRHPVVKYVARLIPNTILCKSEPVKMRHSELMFSSYDIEDLHEPGEPDLQRIGRVNFCAIFAHHLVSLKTKPFSGTQKKPETMGSKNRSKNTPHFSAFCHPMDIF
uniref:Arabidopsis retrotransposon Orf1 C-terminal domain-containing protein n=1 Tax=Noccaea caerulescens TaxID=107243 RepID=A0A1J3JC44_NOCCA